MHVRGTCGESTLLAAAQYQRFWPITNTCGLLWYSGVLAQRLNADDLTALEQVSA